MGQPAMAWRRYTDVAELFSERVDADWQADRERLDDAPAEPWVQR